MSKAAKSVDAALKDMFRALEKRPMPEHVRRAVEQLTPAPKAADRTRQ